MRRRYRGRDPLPEAPMLLARIDVGLVHRVLMPAMEAHTESILGDTTATPAARTEAAYLLARLRSAMTQQRPAAYIREPNPERLRNAAEAARAAERVAACRA